MAIMDDYVWVDFSDADLNKIKERRKLFDGNSRTFNTFQNASGACCEVAFEKTLVKRCIDHEFVNQISHDYEIRPSGLKIDVKGKNCTGIPRPHFEASIPSYSVRVQKPDVYVFSRVLGWADNLKKRTGCWLLGFLTKNEFLERSYQVKRGDQKPNSFVHSFQSKRYESDYHIVEISKLRPMVELYDSLHASALI
jgi:hypothetical protein